jgi:hypothetical protein
MAHDGPIAASFSEAARYRATKKSLIDTGMLNVVRLMNIFYKQETSMTEL